MYDSAIASFRKTLELNPDDESAHYNLAIVYSKKRMYDDAILEYKKVIELNPGLPDVHYNLGVVYSEKGMLMQAKKEVSIYKKLNIRK
jgi:tetratricopeptide (TPR) repeat protein